MHYVDLFDIWTNTHPTFYLMHLYKVESVQALVKLGANVNAQNNMTGATPLHMVAQSQKAGFEARLKVVDVLLEAGAAADQADNYGSLPVHAFQLTGKGDITEAALDDQTRRFVAKLQPRRPDIHVAIVERDLSKLEQVLANDSSIANSTITASQGLTPVSLTVDELLGIVSADKAKEQEVDTLLDILKALLTNGADANGGVDESAIAAAVVTGGEANEPPLHKVVCMLREYYKKAERDESASSAIRTLNTVVDILVGAGATISSDTSLLLHQAARFNELAFARFLIDGLHVDPNTKGRQGMTPLQFAARSGQVEMLVRIVCRRAGCDKTLCVCRNFYSCSLRLASVCKALSFGAAWY